MSKGEPPLLVFCFFCVWVIAAIYVVLGGWIWTKHVAPTLERETGRPPLEGGPSAWNRYVAAYGRVCGRESLSMWRYRFLHYGQRVVLVLIGVICIAMVAWSWANRSSQP
jgi:hypothetical protein